MFIKNSNLLFLLSFIILSNCISTMKSAMYPSSVSHLTNDQSRFSQGRPNPHVMTTPYYHHNPVVSPTFRQDSYDRYTPRLTTDAYGTQQHIYRGVQSHFQTPMSSHVYETRNWGALPKYQVPQNYVYSQPQNYLYTPPRYTYKPLYSNDGYDSHDYFKLCNDNFMYNMKFHQVLSKNFYLFQKIDRFIQPTSSPYFVGVRTSKDSMIEGMYKLYKQKMGKSFLFTEIEGVLPQFQGCVVLSSITNKKVSLKLEKDDVFFIYEKAPLWLDYISEKNLPMTDLNLSEMVHQLFWMFKRLFRARLFAKFFTTNDIGIKTVGDVHHNMNLSVNIYSRKNIMYIFRNMYNISSKCDYVKDTQFQSLLKRFLRDKHRSFQHRGEEDIEICQQINAFNLVLLLEVALYRSNNLFVDKQVLFKGCLDEEEDQGFKCPLALLAVFGKDKHKNQVRTDQTTERFQKGFLNIRTNVLGFTTKSTVRFIGDFLDELLRVFRMYSFGRQAERTSTNYSKQIKYNINSQRNVISKIQEIREKAQKPHLYQELLDKVKNNINRLDQLKPFAKDQNEGYAEDVQEISVKGTKGKMSTGEVIKKTNPKPQRTRPLNVIYREERPFQSKASIDNKMNEFMMQRKEDQEEDGIILEDSEVAQSQILNVEKAQSILKNQEIKQQKTFENKSSDSLQSVDEKEMVHYLTKQSEKTKIKSKVEVSMNSEDDLDDDLQINQTIETIDLSSSKNQEIVKNLIEKDISKIEGVMNKIDEELAKKQTGEIQHEKTSEEIDLNETVVKGPTKNIVEFEEGEQLKFINQIDEQGFEYLSLEINFNLINPKDFGFEDFKQSDQEELEQKVQEHFITALTNDAEMQNLGLKVLDLI